MTAWLEIWDMMWAPKKFFSNLKSSDWAKIHLKLLLLQKFEFEM